MVDIKYREILTDIGCCKLLGEAEKTCHGTAGTGFYIHIGPFPDQDTIREIEDFMIRLACLELEHAIRVIQEKRRCPKEKSNKVLGSGIDPISERGIYEMTINRKVRRKISKNSLHYISIGPLPNTMDARTFAHHIDLLTISLNLQTNPV